MKKPVVKLEFQDNNGSGSSRRRFIKMSSLAFAGSTLLYACSEDDDFNPGMEPEPEPDPDPEVFDLGSGAYYAGAPAEEQELFDDLYNHEVIHREFFRTAIGAATADTPEAMLPDLEFDLEGAGIDIDSRESVLATAMLLEDTGVSAYNGAGDRIELADYLVIAGKIVSVEARHASAIRSLLNVNSADFAGDDVIVPAPQHES